MNRSTRLYLHVPEPQCRPGCEPDFSEMMIPKAGTVKKPAIESPEETLRDYAYSIVRVLDRNGKAIGDWVPELSDDSLRKALKDMMTVRIFDARMHIAQRKGKTAFYVQSLGEEAISCAASMALEDGDMHFPTYRQQGLLLSSDYPIETMMNQVYGNSADPLVGRQLPIMYSSKEFGFFSISGNLGTQFVQAVGWAMASAIDGNTRIASGWIGDGATAESDFYSAMVFASTYRAPVILNIVNNQWAISTFQGIARGDAATFAARGLGFGIPSLRVDGNDYLAVYAVTSWAAQRARSGLGPTLIEHVTYRAGAHSTSDDPSAYRAKGESAAWPLGDPIERLKAHMVRKGIWTEERHTQALAEIESDIIQIQKKAEANGTMSSGAKPSVKEMFEGVYEDMPLHLRRQRQELGV